MTGPLILLGAVACLPLLSFLVLVVVMIHADADPEAAREFDDDDDGGTLPPAYFDADHFIPFDPEAQPYPLPWRQAHR